MIRRHPRTLGGALGYAALVALSLALPVLGPAAVAVAATGAGAAVILDVTR